ncbi:MAG: tetratricopeptide repeat protein [Moraxella sp.]|uniref:tetratricopeptide repeat protein n=1 Tax=Moraxella sp. TaxID=479 RepID=UPI0026DBACEE|nr:tetratricopeptide repeat protein [Moraxella sp.]MDO4450215.1 tetratricopeptide repeat protein [Moraxella sp.]
MFKKLLIVLLSLSLVSYATAETMTDFYGNPIPKEQQQEIEKQVKELEIKANQGNIEAISELTQFYLYSGNQQKTLYWVDKMVENGYPDALTILANAYENGYYGFERNGEKAFDYYLKVANLGEVYSQLWLVDYYLGRRVVEGGICYCGKVDYQKALEWAKKASALGSGLGSQEVAKIYLAYDENNPDYQKAIEYLNLSIKQIKSELEKQPTDSSHTLHLVWTYVDLGETYYQLKNYKEAKVNFEKAIQVADYHSYRAYYGLSLLYRYGYGVPKNIKKADEFHKKSCELGYVPACEN